MIQNKIKYLLLLVFTGLLSVLYNEYVMGIIFLTILIIPIITFLFLLYSYKKVRVEMLSLVHVAVKGETIPVSVKLSNPSFLPFFNLKIYLTVRNGFSVKSYKKIIDISLDSKSDLSVTCNIASEYLGNICISVAEIRFYDYLKIFSVRTKLKEEVKVAVLPQFYDIAGDYMSNRNRQIVESDYYSTVKSGDDPSEVFAIREYREGDRIQRIHWKLSSKLNKLMIKDFSEPLNCSVLIFADLSISHGKNAIACMDALLECSLSLSNFLLSNGQIHYLFWYDEENSACKRFRIVREKDLYEAVDALLQTRPYYEKTDAVTAYLAEHPNDQFTDLFCITQTASYTELTSLSVINASTKQIIYISDNKDSDEEQFVTGSKSDGQEDFVKSAAEMGYLFSVVRTGRLKEDIENLALGSEMVVYP